MRASHLPDKWNLLIDALNQNDVEQARLICIKYEFDKDGAAPKRKNIAYSYKWTSPNGNQGIAGDTTVMAELMGLSPRSLWSMFYREGADDVEWIRGKTAGWKVERFDGRGESDDD